MSVATSATATAGPIAGPPGSVSAPVPPRPSGGPWPVIAAGLALVLTALVSGLAGAWYFGHGSGPTPNPEPPHNSALVKAGKAHRSDVLTAYGRALAAAADAIRDGQDVPKAQAAEQEALLEALKASFVAKLKPVLVQVVPEDAKLSDPAVRAKLEAAYRDLAVGVAGKTTFAPREGFVPRFFGWLDRPSQRAQLVATLPHRTLSEAAPGLFGDDQSPGDVFLYRAWKDVLGEYPAYPAQTIGDCTSFGSSHAIDLLQCIDLALAKADKSLWRETSTEVAYGFGREVAGMLGSRSDGCFGVAVSKGFVELGALPREVVGPYSGQRAKQFGTQGVPADLKAKAAAYKLGSATLVTTTAEADAALANGYPFIICSNQGFAMTRDGSGLCEAHGRWAHCMFVAGRRTRSGESQYLVCQSWGPNQPTGPLADDQPSFSFWIRSQVLAHILSDEDSLAFSRFPGFAKRTIPDHWTYDGFVGPQLPELKAPAPAPVTARKAA